MSKHTQAEKTEAIAKLREWLKPGDTVYTILRHVSRSGMQREISVVINRDGEMLHPNYSVAKALGYRQGKSDGIIMGGCGMDMGFALVYNLSRALFAEGFGVEGNGGLDDGKPWQPRPASKEEAAKMVKAGVKFRGRNGDTSGWDNDGGYALTHRWL